MIQILKICFMLFFFEAQSTISETLLAVFLLLVARESLLLF